MLISNTIQFKEYTGNPSKELFFGLIEPFLRQAETAVLQPLLGTFLTALQPVDLSGTMAQARGLAAAAVALTAYHDSIVSQLYQYGNTGISKLLPKDSEKLAMWEIDTILSDLGTRADAAIEGLMDFLEIHKADLPAWRSSEAYFFASRQLIPSARVLAQVLPQAAMSHRLFGVLQGYMPAVERKHVAGILGQTFLESLKTQQAQGQALTDAEAQLLQGCREVLAPLVLHKALPFIRVKFFPDGVRIYQSFKGLKDEKAADSDQIEHLRHELLIEAEEAKTNLKTYLNETASATVFASYYNSSLYVAPGSNDWKLPDNEGKRHFRL